MSKFTRADAEALIVKLTHERDELKLELESQINHAAIQLSQLKSQHIRTLTRDYKPLLSDAKDALEIEQPALKTAISRLRDALSMIENETSLKGNT